MSMWCLHGNLQPPSVWDVFRNRWHDPDGSPVSLVCPNLWIDSSSGFEEWVRSFCNLVRERKEDSTNWLMGYSMGGRLALHALLEAPELWAGVIVIGADPGYPSSEKRENQLLTDRVWAKRFLAESWNEVLDAWDALPVFCGRPCSTLRQEKDFDRERIAHYFEVFSKGHQNDLLPALSKIKHPPILYITGEEDITYKQIAIQLSQSCPAVRHVSIPAAGHRVPWEATEYFIRVVQEFIAPVSGILPSLKPGF